MVFVQNKGENLGDVWGVLCNFWLGKRNIRFFPRKYVNKSQKQDTAFLEVSEIAEINL